MTSQELYLDHFKFYDVANQMVNVRVKLQGQFDMELMELHPNPYD